MRWLTLLLLTLGSTAHADDIPWPTTVSINEQGESPYYYRAAPSIMAIGVRPSVKGLMRIAGDGGDRVGFGFDIHMVGRLGLSRGRGLGLWPELGYVYSGSEGHFASVGFGI